MSQKSLNSEKKMESRSGCVGNRDRLGLSFTIDYLLFNGGVKGSTVEVTGSSAAEHTEKDTLNLQDPKLEEVEIHCQTSKKSEAGDDKSNTQDEECDEEEQREEGEEEVTTATTCTNSDSEKAEDKPNQSYIALISKAILASEVKKLLLCDIYQWIMDHYPYFKSKVRSYQFTREGDQDIYGDKSTVAVKEGGSSTRWLTKSKSSHVCVHVVATKYIN